MTTKTEQKLHFLSEEFTGEEVIQLAASVAFMRLLRKKHAPYLLVREFAYSIVRPWLPSSRPQFDPIRFARLRAIYASKQLDFFRPNDYAGPPWRESWVKWVDYIPVEFAGPGDWVECDVRKLSLTEIITWTPLHRLHQVLYGWFVNHDSYHRWMFNLATVNLVLAIALGIASAATNRLDFLAFATFVSMLSTNSMLDHSRKRPEFSSY